MSNHLYYGEIAARISANLYLKDDCVSEMDEHISYSHDDEYLYEICSNSARAFSAIEELASDPQIPWNDALDEYTNDVMEHLEMNNNIDILDMVSIASKSVQSYR